MKSIKMELNGKGILLIGLIVLTLTFAFGFACNQKDKGAITLTTNDVKAITKAMEIYGENITVTKSWDGSLKINLGIDFKIE